MSMYYVEAVASSDEPYRELSHDYRAFSPF